MAAAFQKAMDMQRAARSGRPQDSAEGIRPMPNSARGGCPQGGCPQGGPEDWSDDPPALYLASLGPRGDSPEPNAEGQALGEMFASLSATAATPPKAAVAAAAQEQQGPDTPRPEARRSPEASAGTSEKQPRTVRPWPTAPDALNLFPAEWMPVTKAATARPGDVVPLSSVPVGELPPVTSPLVAAAPLALPAPPVGELPASSAPGPVPVPLPHAYRTPKGEDIRVCHSLSRDGKLLIKHVWHKDAGPKQQILSLQALVGSPEAEVIDEVSSLMSEALERGDLAATDKKALKEKKEAEWAAALKRMRRIKRKAQTEAKTEGETKEKKEKKDTKKENKEKKETKGSKEKKKEKKEKDNKGKEAETPEGAETASKAKKEAEQEAKTETAAATESKAEETFKVFHLLQLLRKHGERAENSMQKAVSLNQDVHAQGEVYTVDVIRMALGTWSSIKCDGVLHADPSSGSSGSGGAARSEPPEVLNDIFGADVAVVPEPAGVPPLPPAPAEKVS